VPAGLAFLRVSDHRCPSTVRPFAWMRPSCVKPRSVQPLSRKVKDLGRRFSISVPCAAAAVQPAVTSEALVRRLARGLSAGTERGLAETVGSASRLLLSGFAELSADCRRCRCGRK